MNTYPSWIHRIPEMIEALALIDSDHIDRQAAERLFDLRKTAAIDLLNRMGATVCGQALVISRGQLIARLREAQELPDWRWEVTRTEAVHARIDAILRSPARRSLVPIHPELNQHMHALPTNGLPNSISLTPGRVTIECHSMEHLLEQLVLLAKALDDNFEALRVRVEVPRRPGSAEPGSTAINAQSA
jgi:hypothetical protein